jgi:hypothetical protein
MAKPPAACFLTAERQGGAPAMHVAALPACLEAAAMAAAARLMRAVPAAGRLRADPAHTRRGQA